MSHLLNNELLSAYLDDEVTEAERAQVEQALVDSPETRRQLESLKQVQARLQAIPRLALPADFHEKVLREAAARTAAQPVPPRTASKRWMRVAAMGATVAAALVIAAVIALNQPDTEIVENQLPDDNIVAFSPERQPPLILLVLDLAITKKGQDADLFNRTLRTAGIAYDPQNKGVVLEEKLRDELLSSRFVEGVEPEARANDQFDIVEMVYIQGVSSQMDHVHKTFFEHPEVRAKFNLAFRPESMRVFNAIGERTWSLAKSETNGRPQSYGYRLNVGLRLHSSRSGFFAKFPTPGINLGILEGSESGSTPGFSFPIPLDLGGNPPAQQNDPAGMQPVSDKDDIYEILIIRRDLQAGFPENDEQPAPE